MSDPLLQALEALHAMRTDVCSGRAEGRAQHLETIAKIDGLNERLTLVDARTAAMERKRWTAGLSRLVVGGVAAVAKAAMLGK
jgi:hypothetical protein